MQFRLSTLFLLFVVLWSSLAVFGGGGIVVFIIVVLTAGSIVRPVYFLVLFGFLLLLGLLLPAISCAREAARRCACTNNIRQIALALLNYRQANGCFPPAYIVDKNGRPAHSWRVLILPYLEGQTLYQQYNFNEPWDGPNNKKLLAGRPPMCFVCPSDGNIRISGTACTSYAAVVGADAAWPGKTSGKPAGDPSQTILLVEIAGADIEWTEPKDVSLDALLAKSPGCVTPSSKHLSNDEFFTYTPSAGVNVALADGCVKFLPAGLLDSSPELLKVGGFREENVKPYIAASRRINWTNCAALAVWLASVALLLYRAVWSRKKAILVGVEEAQEHNTIAGS